jgi:hypothetical protein
MYAEERFAKLSEGLYYLVCTLATVGTVWVALEISGYPVRQKIQQAQEQLRARLNQEQFDYFYQHVWPMIRKARGVEEDAE